VAESNNVIELCVEGAAAKVEEEPPAKLLDDLFRKTNALPCIYWLPLTDEQVRSDICVLTVCNQHIALPSHQL